MTTALDVGQHWTTIRFQVGIELLFTLIRLRDFELRKSDFNQTIYTLVSMPRFITMKRFTFLVELTTGRILPDSIWQLVHGHLLALSTLDEMVTVQFLTGSTL